MNGQQKLNVLFLVARTEKPDAMKTRSSEVICPFAWLVADVRKITSNDRRPSTGKNDGSFQLVITVMVYQDHQRIEDVRDLTSVTECRQLTEMHWPFKRNNGSD